MGEVTDHFADAGSRPAAARRLRDRPHPLLHPPAAASCATCSRCSTSPTSRRAASRCAHNGNLDFNFLTLRKRLVAEGHIFQSTSDSEIILQLIAVSRKSRFVDRFVDALSQIEGGYALVGA